MKCIIIRQAPNTRLIDSTILILTKLVNIFLVAVESQQRPWLNEGEIENRKSPYSQIV